MTHNLKALGLALGAMFALGAMSASAASATDLFTTPQATAIGTGTSSNNVLKAGGAELKCQTAAFSATAANNATQITVTASYTGTLGVEPHTSHCGTNGLGAATFDMRSCDYVLTGNTTGSDSGTDATVWITCSTAGDHIVMTNSLCTVKIPAQTPTSGGVTYTNQGTSPNEDVLVTITATGITYTTEGSFCALGGLSAEGNNATYTGTVTIKAFEDLESGKKEGNQINLTVS